jgi:hypothetical protein
MCVCVRARARVYVLLFNLIVVYTMVFIYNYETVPRIRFVIKTVYCNSVYSYYNH